MTKGFWALPRRSGVLVASDPVAATVSLVFVASTILMTRKMIANVMAEERFDAQVRVGVDRLAAA